MVHEPFRVPEQLREAADRVVQIMSEPTHRDALDASGSAADDYPLQVDAVDPASRLDRLDGPTVDRAVREFVSPRGYVAISSRRAAAERLRNAAAVSSSSSRSNRGPIVSRSSFPS